MGIKDFLNTDIKDLFATKQSGETEQKSGGYVGNYTDTPFIDFLGGVNGAGDLRALEAARLYKKCTPFFQSVSMISAAFSSVPIRVYDKKNKVFIDDHPILDLLSKPNPEQSGSEFLKTYSSFFNIAGESFLIATGDQGREPLELFAARPQDVLINASNNPGDFGAAGDYVWSTGFFSERYKLSDSELGGSFRYWNKSNDRELWQAREFNPTGSSNNLRGLSKATPLWPEIQQFILANTNNQSVLSKGARPSIAWVSQLDEPLTDDQYERWKEQVVSYEGALNAGRQILVDNVKPEVVSTTNKDMEFSENRKTVRQDIFSCFNIPLALISAESMTLDNLKTSTLLFWDMAVLPHADDLLDELTLFLMPRYKDSENFVLSYNKIDIQALKEQAIDEVITISKAAILTDNELRTRVGYEEVEGGDSVFKPGNLLPALMDRFTGDNLQDPDNAEKALEDYRNHCKAIVRDNGDRVFSDVEVDLMAKEYGLLK